MNGRDRAGAAAERVRQRLAATQGRRRDAVAKALDAPELCDAAEADRVSEITGRFIALAETQAEAVQAAAKAVARASKPDDSLPPVIRRTKRWGRVAAALAVAAGGFGAFLKWVLKWL